MKITNNTNLKRTQNCLTRSERHIRTSISIYIFGLCLLHCAVRATAMAKTKTKTRDGDGAKKMASSRKRSHKQHSNDDETGKREVGENDRNRMDDEQPTASTSTSTSEIRTETTPSAARPPRRKKRKKASKNNCSSSNSKKLLAGMTISVSTLSDNTKSKNKDTTTATTTTNANTTDNNDNDTETASNPNSYNEVCRSCKELGANVIDLVCKRVTILVCTEAAVKQATQRVRKAIKKNKPLVSVTWLEECQKQGRKVDFEEYRLDKKANDAIQNRENRLRGAEDALLEEFEAIPDSGWSEPKELG